MHVCVGFLFQFYHILFRFAPTATATFRCCCFFFHSRGIFPSIHVFRSKLNSIQFSFVLWNMWCAERTRTPTIRLMPFGVLLCCVVFWVLMFIRVVVPIKFRLYIYKPISRSDYHATFFAPSFDVCAPVCSWVHITQNSTTSNQRFCCRVNVKYGISQL